MASTGSTARRATRAAPTPVPTTAAPHGILKRVDRSRRRHVISETPPRGRSPQSLRTVSPSVIEGTPPRARPYLLDELDEEEIAYLLSKRRARKARAHKHKSRSHHRRRHYSTDYSSAGTGTDSEEDNEPRVFFLDQQGNKPFLKFHERYRAVNIKYSKQIFFETFQRKHLIKLAHSYADGVLKGKEKKKNEEIQEATGLNQLLRCFDVYCQAICHFAARPHVALKLHKALIDYRIRVSDFSVHYRFDSIRAYFYAFMAARMINGQDDPLGWMTEDPVLYNNLIRKTTLTINDNRPYPGGPAYGEIGLWRPSKRQCRRHQYLRRVPRISSKVTRSLTCWYMADIVSRRSK